MEESEELNYRDDFNGLFICSSSEIVTPRLWDCLCNHLSIFVLAWETMAGLRGLLGGFPF